MSPRERRAARNLTLAEAARQVGTDPGNLSRIERGHQAAEPGLASRLAALLECDLETIYSPYLERSRVQAAGETQTQEVLNG